MRLEKTRFVLEHAQSVLLQRELEQQPVSSFFTEYILIVFYAEIQEKLEEVILDVLRSSCNDKVALFIANTLATIIRRIDKSDLQRTLKQFGKDKAQAFTSNLGSILIKIALFARN